MKQAIITFKRFRPLPAEEASLETDEEKDSANCWKEQPKNKIEIIDYNVVAVTLHGFCRHVDLQEGAPDEFYERTGFMCRLSGVMAQHGFTLVTMKEFFDGADHIDATDDTSEVRLTFDSGSLHALIHKHPELDTECVVTPEMIIALKSLEKDDLIITMPLTFDIPL